MFKPVIRRPRKDGFFQVYIRVMQNRKPGYIKTDKVVTKDYLDKNNDITDPFRERVLHEAHTPFHRTAQPCG